MSSYRELFGTARELLKQSKIIDADIDAWYLLEHVFGINRTQYYLHEDEQVPDKDNINKYMNLVQLRAKHIPLQHITGTQEFFGLEYEVNEDVLIPRQDTELLVEEVLKVSSGKDLLDMCCGSGCIIISLAKLGKPNKATGVDISEKALAVAQKNACKHEVDIVFIRSDLFDGVEESYDIIVSNPPYIPTDEIEKLMPEVKYHEPRLALDGMSDGLEFYRKIAAASKKHLRKAGYLFLEIGHNQGEAVKHILSSEGFYDVNVKKDLSGHDRVVSARWL